MDKASLPLTEEEAKQVLSAITEGDKFVILHGAYILVSSISGIYPEELLEKTDKHEGRLHDGTRVIKQFGVWKDANNPDIRLNTAHYPEIARDEVLTEKEWKDKKEIKQLK